MFLDRSGEDNLTGTNGVLHLRKRLFKFIPRKVAKQRTTPFSIILHV